MPKPLRSRRSGMSGKARLSPNNSAVNARMTARRRVVDPQMSHEMVSRFKFVRSVWHSPPQILHRNASVPGFISIGERAANPFGKESQLLISERFRGESSPNFQSGGS